MYVLIRFSYAEESMDAEDQDQGEIFNIGNGTAELVTRNVRIKTTIIRRKI